VVVIVSCGKLLWQLSSSGFQYAAAVAAQDWS
jgi:hypothetical protein